MEESVFGIPQEPSAEERPAEQSIRYLEALTFLFSAPGAWGNLFRLTVLLLIPVAGQIALMGWHCEIVQRLARKHPKPIPNFNFSDFTHYLSRGVSPFVTQMILRMPVAFIFGAIGGVIGAMASVLLRTSARSGTPPMFLLGLYAGFLLLSFLIGPFLAILVNSGLVRAELTEELGKTLSASALWAYIRKTWLTTLVSSFVFSFFSMVLVVAGLLCCYVGVFPAVVIMMTGLAHLRFQVYQKYLARGGEPIPTKAPVAIPSEQEAGISP